MKAGEQGAAPAPGKVGRPRGFDEERALDCAMKVFWEKGYEGSSLDELTRAMGISRPSLYAVFGNKESLFHKALVRYNAMRACLFEEALAQPRSRDVVERYLTLFVDAQTEPENPRGCLEINGALACSDEARPIRDDLAAHRFDQEVKLCARFRRAVDEGDLPPGANPGALARYVTAVSQGMAVQAGAGASRGDLHEVIAMALRAWPAGGAAIG